MRIIIIGGTGHIGTFLVPRLVTAEHEVVVVSRGMRKAYQAHAAWADVRMVTIERTESEKAGEFGKSIRELKLDAVIELTCFDIESAQHLVDAYSVDGALRDSLGARLRHPGAGRRDYAA